MRKFVAVSLFAISIACAPVNLGHVQPLAVNTMPLTGDQLRRLLGNTNTVFAPVRFGEVIVDHPPGEFFRQNGSYRRITGRTGLEGTYSVEGDTLCVTGDSIPKRCRQVSPQGGQTYLLIDVCDSSRDLVDLSQGK